MLTHVLNTAVNTIENGYVPDVFIRLGIQRILRDRLKTESRGNNQDWQNRKQVFLESATNSPVAVMPQKANEQHYEVPALFFEKVLGRRLKYSCCFWPHNVINLDQAEEAALELSCHRAELEDGMSILELGCGWGSLSLWMAEKYPNSTITAVSNSNSQRAFIKNQAEHRSIKNLQVITADMNDFNSSGHFDRVVSIEMFEHMRNHQELLRRISQWLKPEGKLFVHLFCHRLFAYPYETTGPANWMGRHFFSGGMMPSSDLLLRYQRHLNVVNQWALSGDHYKKTCDAWLANLDFYKEELLDMFQDAYGASDARRWLFRWRIFFISCSELFAYNRGNEWSVSHYLFQRS